MQTFSGFVNQNDEHKHPHTSFDRIPFCHLPFIHLRFVRFCTTFSALFTQFPVGSFLRSERPHTHTHTYACIYNRRTIFSRWLLFGLPFLSVNITTQIHFICRNLLAFIFGPRKPNENHFLVRRLAEKLFGEKFFSYAFSFSFSFVHIYLHTSVKSFCLMLASTFCSNFNNRTELLTLIKLKPKWKLQFIWHAKSCLLRHYHPSHRHRMLRSFREKWRSTMFIEKAKKRV